MQKNSSNADVLSVVKKGEGWLGVVYRRKERGEERM
jgi:hypothetical protein